MNDSLLTLIAAARVLRVSTATIEAMIKDDRLRAINSVGNPTMLVRHDVEAMRKSRGTRRDIRHNRRRRRA